MDEIAMWQSTTIFLCIRPFSAWWQPKERLTNRVILLQACSWPVKRRYFAKKIKFSFTCTNKFRGHRPSCPSRLWGRRDGLQGEELGASWGPLARSSPLSRLGWKEAKKKTLYFMQNRMNIDNKNTLYCTDLLPIFEPGDRRLWGSTCLTPITHIVYCE